MTEPAGRAPDLPAGGRVVTEADAEAGWRGWTPWQVAERLRDVSVPWGVAAGWALELFLGVRSQEQARRPHSDLEIAIPQAGFEVVRRALPDLEFDVVGAGQAWVYQDVPAAAVVAHQTWGRTADGTWVLDVFREPHDGDTWICRRTTSLTRPMADLYARTEDGVPYVVPEVVLLFKAKQARDKDVSDFEATLPHLAAPARDWLREALDLAHPGHAWLERLSCS